MSPISPVFYTLALRRGPTGPSDGFCLVMLSEHLRVPTGHQNEGMDKRLLIQRWQSWAAMILTISLFAPGTLFAKEQTVSLSATVDAGKEHITRLRNLPQDAFLSVSIEIDGAVGILLLDERNLRLPPDTRKSLFESQTADKLRIGVRIPETGIYYLVVDNRAGNTQREFSLDVTGRSGQPGKDSESAELPDSTQKTQLDEQMARFAQNLRRYFVFEDLQFRFARCGTANAYSSDDTVIICIEIAPLLKELGDKAKANDVFIFALMHEVGHVLLQQWGYPFHGNEEVADEFATALLVLFGQGERARTAAELFATQPAQKELEIKREQFDRHPLSVQRARNILKWLEDTELLKRWQKVFVPHMQTHVLKAMTLSNKPWIDLPLVERELTLRAD